MGMDYDVSKLKMPEVLLVGALIFLVISPGYLLCFEFERKLFLSLDWFKLTMISVSTSAPIFFITFHIAMVFEAKIKFDVQSSKVKGILFLSCIYTFFIIYALVLLKYFFNISIALAALSIIALEGISSLFMYAVIRGLHKVLDS